jgi:glutamate-5-semialdehyde dehydrogenase
MQDALVAEGYSADLVQTIDEYGREGGVALMQARGLVDLLVPRGGAALIQTVVLESKVPVIETGTGNVHIYVDESADIEKALPIILNAKTQRVGVCNAVETLLVHEGIADKFVPLVTAALTEQGVIVHADDVTQQLSANSTTTAATDADWETEYLSLDIAAKVVPSIDTAIEHIRRYTTGHTEVIVTESLAAANQFTDEVDAAVVMVNASSRFTDGAEFGLGAELGISTQKLHARGPMGLAELTTTKWIVEGNGQVRP